MKKTANVGGQQEPVRQIELMQQALATGLNSVVYRLQDGQVAKLYGEDIDLKLLQGYKDLTDRAIKAVAADGFKGRIVLDGDEYTYSFTVNPVNEITVERKTGRYATLSQWIPGPTVNSLCSGVAFEPHLEEVDGVEARDALRRVRGWVESGTEMHSRFYGILSHASKRMQSVSGGSKVHLSGENVKVDLDPAKRRITFIVTDLMTDLTYLKE